MPLEFCHGYEQSKYNMSLFFSGYFLFFPLLIDFSNCIICLNMCLYLNENYSFQFLPTYFRKEIIIIDVYHLAPKSYLLLPQTEFSAIGCNLLPTYLKVSLPELSNIWFSEDTYIFLLPYQNITTN